MEAQSAQHRPDRPGDGAHSDAEVALLDLSGTVVAVNEAWERFARENGGDPDRTGVGTSYLGACEGAGEDPVAALAGAAVRAALAGQLPAPLSAVIPCHGPDGDRWFDMLVSPRLDDEHVLIGAAVTLSPRADPPDREPRDVRVHEQLRIAAELHARVVHKLFAIAMDLQGLAALVGDQRTKRRLWAGVDAVDDTILAIRRTVFDLDDSSLPPPGLRQRLSQVLDEVSAGSGLATTLAVPGMIDRSVSDRQAVDVAGVVGEIVLGAVRDVSATSVDVRLRLDRDEIVVDVLQDGSGRPTGHERAALPVDRWGGRWISEVAPGGAGRRTLWAVGLDPPATAGTADSPVTPYIG